MKLNSSNERLLAVLGGTPKFESVLHIGRPNLGNFEAFAQRSRDIWARRWLTNDGPYLREFEEQIQSRLGVGHAIAVANGTIGLELAIRALDLQGEVIVPSFTFIATAHALKWLGVRPVFCDISSTSHNIDPQEIESLITPQTTGIMGVHLWGEACDVEALQLIAERRGIHLLYDASHAFGNSINGTAIGNFGEAEVFSFHATKFVNTFEGGLITTNNPQLADKLRLMRNFGFRGYDQVAELGTNGKMSEISAAMGLTSLESMEEFIACNRENYRSYSCILTDVPGIKLLEPKFPDESNLQYVVCEITPETFGLTRDELQLSLVMENIRARRYFYPGCHQSIPYRTASNNPTALPNTELATSRVLQLPTGTAIGPDEINLIGELIRNCHDQAPAIRRRLQNVEIVDPNTGLTTPPLHQ